MTISITLYCKVRKQGQKKQHFYITIPQEHVKGGLLEEGATYEVTLHPLPRPPEKPVGKETPEMRGEG